MTGVQTCALPISKQFDIPCLPRFLSPHFNFFPTVSDTANINAWSEIGVIFLLFALGLEFSFYKLKSVGSTAFIATFVEIGGMLIVGYFTGHILGWDHMDSLFLGGMLAMSSTTIIIKAFEDLKLKGQIGRASCRERVYVLV